MLGIAIDAGVHQSAPEVESWRLDRKRPVAIEADDHGVVAFPQARFELVAHADVDADVRTPSEIVLDESGKVVRVEVVAGADVESSGHRIPEQQAGERIARVGAAGIGVGPLGERWG